MSKLYQYNCYRYTNSDDDSYSGTSGRMRTRPYDTDDDDQRPMRKYDDRSNSYNNRSRSQRDADDYYDSMNRNYGRHEDTRYDRDRYFESLRKASNDGERERYQNENRYWRARDDNDSSYSDDRPPSYRGRRRINNN